MVGDEHPVAQHEYQLNALEERVSSLEGQVSDLAEFKSSSKAQLDVIFKTLDELKQLLREYTTEMKGAMATLSNQLSIRLGQVEQDVRNISAKPGEKAVARWDNVLNDIIKIGVVGLLGWLIAGGKS